MGRPKKEVLSGEDLTISIIEKLFDPTLENGKLVFKRNTNTLTLEEYAHIDWWMNGCKGKPLTKMGQLKREAKLCEKMRKSFKKIGITKLSDVMNVGKSQKNANEQAAVGGAFDEEWHGLS